MSHRIWIITFLCGLGIAASVHAAQQPPPSTSDELLTEVRVIRMELQEAAGISIQAQLLVARLQIQEQRINMLTGRLETGRRSIATQRAVLQTMNEQLTQMERNQQVGTIPPEDLRVLEGSINGLKRRVAEGEQEVKQLEAQENDLTEQLDTEQARWADFNNRLDELERRLSTR